MGFAGLDGKVHYSEGIFVGYRGYEKFGIAPQYPFGFGLSYTNFAYANLRVSRESISSDDAQRFSVRDLEGHVAERPQGAVRLVH